MKRNLLRFIFILFGIIFIYFLKNSFAEYNLEKSISACVVAKKQTSKSFDLAKAKKDCEEKIRK
tara:strand:+ start:826 stop:1017 length:192 start_codon:yes stop_codon:yes gene_type:complete